MRGNTKKIITMKKISLGKLEQSRLSEENMKHLRGGDYTEVTITQGVRCGCRYANNGGSSTNANHDANVKADLWTVKPDIRVQTVLTNDALSLIHI